MLSHHGMVAGGVKFISENVRHKLDNQSDHGIPLLQSTLFACILEDCIIQLRILSQCNNELRIMKTNSDMGLLLAKKFHVKRGNDMDDIDKISQKDMGSNEHKLNKLFSDRLFFSDMLRKTYRDMALNNSFNSLTASIKTIEDRDDYRAKLAEEESNNKMARRELMKQLRQQRNHIKSIVYDTNLAVENLRCQVEDTELNSEIRSRFVENWQRARTEQHIQSISDEETGPSDAIQYYQTRSDQEQRVHAEVELLVNIFINESLTHVENWMTKFDIDMEEQDLKIAKMKNRCQDITEKREELEETYASHDVLAKNWLQFKADRQAANDYREKMENSALIVQAWWRGLLVRLQMGPYKPSKRSRPAASGAKKKKKK